MMDRPFEFSGGRGAAFIQQFKLEFIIETL